MWFYVCNDESYPLEQKNNYKKIKNTFENMSIAMDQCIVGCFLEESFVGRD